MIEEFLVERWMDEYETRCSYNLAESCCKSLSLKEVEDLINENIPIENILNVPLDYGSIKGSKLLRNSVSSIYNEYMNKENSYNKHDKISENNVLIANGGIEANFLVFYGLLNANDHIISINPTYQQLYSVGRSIGVNVSLLELKEENNFLPNVSEIEKLLKPNTKMLVLNNPNNPTGAVIPTYLLIEIIEKICKPNNLYLFIDEVYRPLYHSYSHKAKDSHVDETIPASVVELYHKGISTGSISKAFSLAGLRIGWIVSHDKKALKEILNARDYTTISVSKIDDMLASWSLSRGWKQILERNFYHSRTQRSILLEFIENNSEYFSLTTKLEAGTTAFIRINNVKDTIDFCKGLMEKHKVLLIPGECFGYKGFVRLGYATCSAHDLKIGLECLLDCVK